MRTTAANCSIRCSEAQALLSAVSLFMPFMVDKKEGALRRNFDGLLELMGRHEAPTNRLKEQHHGKST